VKQSRLRQKLIDAMFDCLIEEGMPELTACLEQYPEDYDLDPALAKAIDSAYRSMQDSLKQISRLAVRLGYLEKNIV